MSVRRRRVTESALYDLALSSNLIATVVITHWARPHTYLFTGYMLCFEHTLFLKKFNFLNALKFSQNWMLVSLFELTAVQELTSIYDQYTLHGISCGTIIQ